MEKKLLTLIKPPLFDVEIDMMYATPNNFTGQIIYNTNKCFLHPDAAECLKVAISLAAELKLKICIFDAFRPISAQFSLWKHCPDPAFVADPKKGSPHSRGVALDITLINNTNGEPLDMGGEVDDLSPKGAHGYREVSAKAQKNRMLLLGLMATAGFDHYLNEWWHYQLYNTKDYPLIDNIDINTNLENDD